MSQVVPATVLTTAGLILLAVPGAAWVAAFEASAGRQAPTPDSGSLVRFVKAAMVTHLLLAPISLAAVIWVVRGAPGVDLRGDVAEAWLTPLALLFGGLLIYAVGPLLLGYASGVRVRSRGAGLLAAVADWLQSRSMQYSVLGRLPAPSKGLLYPRAWDFVFSQNQSLYIRARLHSGRWIAGFVGRHEHDLTESYATSHPHEPEVFCAHRVGVDPDTGAWTVDEHGELMVDPGGGLIVRAAECEYVEVMYAYPVAEEVRT